MADVQVVVVGPAELPLIAGMYNEMFRPPKDEQFFRRRFLGRHNPLILVAQLDNRPVGFATGFELKPSVFFAWLTGVLPDFRRQGIASQLHEVEDAWAGDHGYHYMRMECHNATRPILHMAIDMNYDIVGIRWDADHSDNLVIFEKVLDTHE